MRCCLALLLVLAGVQPGQAQERVYELRTYVTNEGKLPDLNRRFAEHTMRLFEKHGMQNHIYWIPPGDEKNNTLIYILSHESREAATRSWEAFLSDPEWKEVAAASEEGGKILAQRPESVFLQPTDFSPQNFESQEEPRLFQLRRYTTVAGKLPALLERFREGELALFERHGITNIAYFTALDMSDTLICVVAHQDAEAMRRSWEGFRQDPEWQQLWERSTSDGKIVIKVDRQVLEPVEYSPVK